MLMRFLSCIIPLFCSSVIRTDKVLHEFLFRKKKVFYFCYRKECLIQCQGPVPSTVNAAYARFVINLVNSHRRTGRRRGGGREGICPENAIAKPEQWGREAALGPQI